VFGPAQINVLKAKGLEYPRDYSLRAMGIMPDRLLAMQPAASPRAS
jgi:hypothetical protein